MLTTINRTNWTIREQLPRNAETLFDMIRNQGLRKFNVIDENETEAGTLEIYELETDNADMPDGEVKYLYIAPSAHEIEYYAESSIVDFVELQLLACRHFAQHWTVNA